MIVLQALPELRPTVQSTPVDRGMAVRRIFDLYTDYVLKNPFYEMEMPIRCELFDQHLFYTITGLHRRWGHAA